MVCDLFTQWRDVKTEQAEFEMVIGPKWSFFVFFDISEINNQ